MALKKLTLASDHTPKSAQHRDAAEAGIKALYLYIPMIISPSAAPASLRIQLPVSQAQKPLLPGAHPYLQYYRRLPEIVK
jgi:hypothetical protein